MKKIALVLAIILMIPMGINSYAQKKNDKETIRDIENKLLDYFKENNIKYTLGSEEYINYLVSILLEDKDKVLAKKPYYDSVLFYASKYLNELEGRTLEENDIHRKKEKIDPISDIENKTIRELKKEVKEKNNKIEEEIIKFKEENKDIPTPFAGYSGGSAAKYAQTWYNKRNSKYNSHPYDCTNFVSQAVLAGGKGMLKLKPLPTGMKATTSYWYSEKYQEWKLNHYLNRWKESTSWVRVEDFYSFWAKYQKTLTSSNKSTIVKNANVGDVVQFRRSNGDWFHSMVVTRKANGTIYLSGHTSNVYNKDLKNITSANMFRVIKFTF